MASGREARVLVAERDVQPARDAVLAYDNRYGLGFLTFVALVGAGVLTFILGMIIGIAR